MLLPKYKLEALIKLMPALRLNSHSPSITNIQTRFNGNSA